MLRITLSSCAAGLKHGWNAKALSNLTSADRDVLYARRCLEFHPIAVRAEDWGRTLSTFEIDRKRDGTVVDHSRATDVLGGPVSALRYLVVCSRAIRRTSPPIQATRPAALEKSRQMSLHGPVA